MNDSTPRRGTLSVRDRWLALIFCVATVLLFLSLRTPDSGQIETRTLAEIEPVSNLAQPTEPDWGEASLQYRSGMYNSAASQYRTLVRTGPDDRRARLFWGSCQLQSRRFDAAELTLRPLLTPGTLDSVEAAARWLLAQVYLARDEGEPAGDELTRLIGDITYGARAQKKSKALEGILQEQ